MSNATYMAGVIITICIVTAIIITIIAMCLSKKVDELENRLEGLAEAINRKTALANNRIDDVERSSPERSVLSKDGMAWRSSDVVFELPVL